MKTKMLSLFLVLATPTLVLAEEGQTSISYSTRCQDITLNLPSASASVSVFLSKDGLFETGEGLQDENTKIDGLKVEILQDELVDHEKKSNYSFVHVMREIDVFSVKLRLTANEIIGHKLMGDIMKPVKEVTTYTHCFSTTTSIIGQH